MSKDKVSHLRQQTREMAEKSAILGFIRTGMAMLQDPDENIFNKHRVHEMGSYEQAVLEGLNEVARREEPIIARLEMMKRGYQNFNRNSVLTQKLEELDSYRKVLAEAILETLRSIRNRVDAIDESIQILRTYGQGIALAEIEGYEVQLREIYSEMTLSTTQDRQRFREIFAKGMDL